MNEKLKRYLIFLVGLFVNSLGVSLVTKANLGTSPISSIPYVLSLNFPLTLGNFTILMSIVLILLQVLILRKNFKLEYLLQAPISVAFGYFIDWTMILLAKVDPQIYGMKLLVLFAGCLVLGFGVYLEVLADVAMLPGESFVRAVAGTWHFEFGITKIVFDASMTVIAGGMSFVFAHALVGVREGTVIAALLVGFIARTFGRMLAGVKTKLFPEKADKEAAEDGKTEQDFCRNVIVIGREYGSGGHDMGKLLAERLGYAFYDRDIIRMAAGTTGFSDSYIEQREEAMTNSLLYDLVNQMYVYSPEHETPKDQIFEAEAKVVRDLADKGNCVIVGRMSDYVLRDRKGCLKLFFHTSLENRIKRIAERLQISEKEAEEKIRHEEKRRADNYRYYTHRLWGYAGNYDASINTAYGIDAIESIVLELQKINVR